MNARTPSTITLLKTAFGLGMVILLANGGSTTALASETASSGLSAGQILQATKDTYASLTSYGDEGRIVDASGGVTTIFSTVLARTNFYRIEWVAHDDSRNTFMGAGVQSVWSAGAGDFLNVGRGTRWQQNREFALANAASAGGVLVTTVPMAFFQVQWPDALDDSAAEWVRAADERAGGNDCYVLLLASRGQTKTLWIGKQDFLVRQVQTVINYAAMRDSAASINAELARRLHGFTLTETHTNIVVNHSVTRTDFVPSSPMNTPGASE